MPDTLTPATVIDGLNATISCGPFLSSTSLDQTGALRS